MLQSLRHRSVGRRKPPASRIALTFNYRALVLATSRLRIFSHFLQAPQLRSPWVRYANGFARNGSMPTDGTRSRIRGGGPVALRHAR